MSERTTSIDTIITQHFLKSYGVVCAWAEHSQAKLEGLLEGLREAITGRIAAS